MSRPKLLDLFCGGGGAAMGYHRAGFEVTGVDIVDQPHYPFTFIQADAMTFLRAQGWGFDVIHASPPCQRYMTGGLVNRAAYPDLLAAVRTKLKATDKLWVIENVPGAPMRPDATLCGSQFGLAVRRHRWFELSTQPLIMIPPCDHTQPVTGVYGHPHGAVGAWPGMLSSDLRTWQDAMGIDWMTAAELSEAIPPAYTQFIGTQLLEELSAPDVRMPA